MKVLMIDDDLALCKLMKEYFELEEIEFDFCFTGKTWPVLLKKESYDAVLLDLSLPELNGLTVLKKIVKENDIPVLLFTAQGSDLDHIAALELGAEDYIDKPCNPPVLISRIKKILEQKASNRVQQKKALFSLGTLVIDFDKRSVFVNEEKLKITTTEFKILEVLASQPEKGFTKNEISRFARDRNVAAFDRSLDAHMFKLRKKIEDASRLKLTIETIYGYGYKLVRHD